MRRGQRYPPEVRSQEEIERLLDACGRSFTGRPNRTLLVLLWRFVLLWRRGIFFGQHALITKSGKLR